MTIIIKRNKSNIDASTQSAQRDIVTGGIVVAAAIMFIGTGTQMLSSTIDLLNGVGGGANNTLTVALLLNIALILFGWRRYRDLTHEIKERKIAQERAQILAMRDPLTGFHNRRSLSENGVELLTKTLRRQKALAMLVLEDRKSTRLNSSHRNTSRMPSSA